MDESSGYSVTIDEAFEFALDRLGYKKLKQEQEKVLRAFVSGNSGVCCFTDWLWEIPVLRLFCPPKCTCNSPTNVGITATPA